MMKVIQTPVVREEGGESPLNSKIDTCQTSITITPVPKGKAFNY